MLWPLACVVTYASSEYFAALFASGSIGKDATVVLQFDDQSGVFPDVLRFLYAGNVQIKVRLTLSPVLPNHCLLFADS